MAGIRIVSLQATDADRDVFAFVVSQIDAVGADETLRRLCSPPCVRVMLTEVQRLYDEIAAMKANAKT